MPYFPRLFPEGRQTLPPPVSQYCTLASFKNSRCLGPGLVALPSDRLLWPYRRMLSQIRSIQTASLQTNTYSSKNENCHSVVFWPEYLTSQSLLFFSYPARWIHVCVCLPNSLILICGLCHWVSLLQWQLILKKMKMENRNRSYFQKLQELRTNMFLYFGVYLTNPWYLCKS